MGISRALINKLKRRRKSLNPNRGFRRQDKIDRKDEVLADSPGAYKYIRGIQRRYNANFGKETIASPKKVPMEVLVQADIERIDFGSSDFGIEMTLAAGLIAEIGLQPGDLVTVLSETLKGVSLEVVSIESGTVVRLEDVATFTGPETVQTKCKISGLEASYV